MVSVIGVLVKIFLSGFSSVDGIFMTRISFGILSALFFFGIARAGEIYEPKSRLNPKIEVESDGNAYLVKVEIDKMPSNRPSVSKAVQRSEAEHFVLVGLTMHLKAPAKKLEIIGKEILSEEVRGSRLTYRFSIASVRVEREIEESGPGDGHAVDSEATHAGAGVAGIEFGGDDLGKSRGTTPRTKVGSVQVSESLSRRLSRIPTSLSEVNDEWIERFQTCIVCYGKDLEASGRGDEFEDGVREIVGAFSLFVENDIRVMTFDKVRLRKKFDEMVGDSAGIGVQ